jgi:4a-hydroxytetrahydrobiopterin dehydratase
MDLTKKRCVPCEGRVVKLDGEQVMLLLADVPGWASRDERLQRSFRFPDFRAAMKFVNQVADLAEAEGHHPDFSVHYDRVDFEIWTHAASGLTENDFILAAKIGELTASK